MKPISAVCPVLLTFAALAAASSPAVGQTLGQVLNGRALASLEERLEEDPRHPGLLTDYANLLVKGGRQVEAQAAYETALSIAPTSLNTLYNLALLQLELGRLDLARRHLRTCLEIDPSFARGHYAMGSFFAAKKKHRRALRHFSTAFQLDPDLRDPQRNPEILFNSLATWASIQAYTESSVGQGSRIYEDPQPIIGVLMEELDASPTDEPDPSAEPPVAQGAIQGSDDG